MFPEKNAKKTGDYYNCLDIEVGFAIQNSQVFTQDNGTIRQLVASLLCALQAKDKGSLMHSIRVARYSSVIVADMGLDTEWIAKAYLGGVLHDIGKISIPDSILFKSEPLTDAEFSIIKSHPEISEEICRPITVFSDILPAIRGHHERVDGKGYPDGSVGEDIPLLSRIIAVADSFDAMTSNRPYRKHLDIQSAWDILKDGAGTQWDASVIETLRLNFDKNRFRYNLGKNFEWERDSSCCREDSLSTGTIFV